MKDLKEVFAGFERLRVLVIGDVMIDSYVWGSVNRISPEAPVPIVQARQQEKRLGGAANVALNLKALGAQPVLCAVVGQDEEAQVFERLLAKAGISGEGILRDRSRVTTIKHRIIAGTQHMLRIDSEVDTPVSPEMTDALVARVGELLADIQVIIFEDYDKGVLTSDAIRRIIGMARERGIPTVVDPKKRNFLAYVGCSLFKPNLKELKEGLKIDFQGTTVEDLQRAATLLHEQMQIEAALITLSEHGVFVTNFAETHHIPAHLREIADVSGAGDTVVSIAALCLASGLSLRQVAGIANLGGGLVCQSPGVVPVDKSELLSEALKYYA